MSTIISNKIASTEFFNRSGGGLDHRPSVYLVEAPTDDELKRLVIQVAAEHSVSFLQRPPKGIPPADVARENQRLSAKEGVTEFSFANAQHRELLLKSDADVIALANLLIAERNERRLDYSTHIALVAYAREQIDGADTEWTTIMEQPGKKKWAKATANLRSTSKDTSIP